MTLHIHLPELFYSPLQNYSFSVVVSLFATLKYYVHLDLSVVTPSKHEAPNFNICSIINKHDYLFNLSA